MTMVNGKVSKTDNSVNKEQSRTANSSEKNEIIHNRIRWRSLIAELCINARVYMAYFKYNKLNMCSIEL